MCFSVPLKVLEIKKGSAFVEGGKTVRLDNDIRVKKGQYLRIVGNIAVDSLSKKEGEKIRYILNTYKNHDK